MCRCVDVTASRGASRDPYRSLLTLGNDTGRYGTRERTGDEKKEHEIERHDTMACLAVD